MSNVLAMESEVGGQVKCEQVLACRGAGRGARTCSREIIMPSFFSRRARAHEKAESIESIEEEDTEPTQDVSCIVLHPLH